MLSLGGKVDLRGDWRRGGSVRGQLGVLVCVGVGAWIVLERNEMEMFSWANCSRTAASSWSWCLSNAVLELISPDPALDSTLSWYSATILSAVAANSSKSVGGCAAIIRLTLAKSWSKKSLRSNRSGAWSSPIKLRMRSSNCDGVMSEVSLVWWRRHSRFSSFDGA